MAIRLRMLNTTSEVIDALGGNKPFGVLISTEKIKRCDQHVSNYRRTGVFPPDSYLVVQAALKKIGLAAPPRLWRIIEPKPRRARRTG